MSKSMLSQTIEVLEQALNSKTGATIIIFNQDTHMTFFLSKDVSDLTLQDIMSGLIEQLRAKGTKEKEISLKN